MTMYKMESWEKFYLELMGYPSKEQPWRFGTILSADYWHGRIMVLAPVSVTEAVREKWRFGLWRAVVLVDEDKRYGEQWEQGKIITLSPEDAGIRIVATPEDE